MKGTKTMKKDDKKRGEAAAKQNPDGGRRSAAAAMQNPKGGDAKNAEGGETVAPKIAEYRRERREIAVGTLRAAPWNPRGGITPESVADLAASIASIGLIQPLVAMEDGTLVCGHRRLAAAKAAGLETVPVDVLVGVDEATAKRMTFIENLQRRDADPLMESELVNGLVNGGMTREEIAAETGRGARWVARRLNLANLSESWRKRVADGEEITVDCLEHVAAYPKEIQEKLKGVGDCWSPQLRWCDIRQGFSNATCDLKGARFDRKKCKTCPKNTGCAPDLFDQEGRATAFGRCMDEKCFRRMTDLAVEKAKENAKRDGLLVCEVKEHPDWEVDLQDKRDSEHATLYVWKSYDGGMRSQWGRAPVAKADKTGAVDKLAKEERRQKIAAGKARKKLAAWCVENLAWAIAQRFVVDVSIAWAFQAVFDIGDSWRIFGSRTSATDAALAHLLVPDAVDRAPANWAELAAPEIAKRITRAEIGGTYAERFLAIFPAADAALTEDERRLIVSDERLAKLRKRMRVDWVQGGTDGDAAEDAEGAL